MDALFIFHNIDAAEAEMYFFYSSSFSKPGAYVTHNAPQPPKVQSATMSTMLVATNVALSPQAAARSSLRRTGKCTSASF